MQLTHYGHACVLVDFGPGGDGTRLLIDPGSYSNGFEELRDLDAVLITHGHPDHLDIDRVTSLLDDNPTARLIVDEGSSTALEDAGLRHEVAIPGRALTVGSVGVEAYDSPHAVIHPRLSNIGNTGYLLDGRVLHPGDSFKVLTGPVDVLFLPAGGPFMKVSDCMSALKPHLVIPIHQAGLASIHQHMHYQLMRDLAPEDTEVVVLEEGVPLEWDR